MLLNLLQETLEVLGLALEEVDFVLALLPFILTVLVDDAFDGLNLGLQLILSLLLLFLAFLKLTTGFFELGAAVLSLKLLAHCKGD